MVKIPRLKLTVNLQSIYRNCLTVKKRLKQGVKLCAVVKANAYGHGMLKVAGKIKGICDYFAVATVEEALELRSFNKDINILLFGYFEKSDLLNLLNAKINLTAFDIKTLKELNAFAQKHNQNFLIHIKFDCGMNRVGYKTTNECLKLIETLKSAENIVLNGLYTHFASGDLKDRVFLSECAARFEKQALLFKNYKKDIIIHAAATPTAFLGLNLQYDMVRLGLALYGYNGNDDTNYHLNLYPALNLKAGVIQVKKVKELETIGYSRNFTAAKDMKIAVVCCGYGDGYNRLLSNKGTVVINNKPCKICGNVCMDLLMADCTGCKRCAQALLISENKFKEYIGIEKIAKDNNTIVYEVLTSLPDRCQRVYVNE